MSETVVKYELRKLCARDIFPVSKILSKIGIKEFKECFNSDEVKEAIKEMQKASKDDTPNVDVSEIGLTVALGVADVLLNNISACEEYIYQLLSSLSGISKKDIAELPMDVFVAMIIDVIKKEEFKDFIQAVSKLLK